MDDSADTPERVTQSSDRSPKAESHSLTLKSYCENWYFWRMHRKPFSWHQGDRIQKDLRKGFFFFQPSKQTFRKVPYHHLCVRAKSLVVSDSLQP